MSKMRQELEKRLDENKYEMYDALEGARQDINWMLNNERFLMPFTFDYIEEVLNKIEGK